MLTDPPASPAQIDAAAAVIEEWIAADPPLVLGVEAVPAERRWLIRLRGEEKSVITVWLTLGERTLQAETALIPAPEENVAECFEYLLRANLNLYGMRFAIGAEDAIYLRAGIPVRMVDDVELDHVIGASYAYIERYFRTALAIGFASRVAAPR